MVHVEYEDGRGALFSRAGCAAVAAAACSKIGAAKWWICTQRVLLEAASIPLFERGHQDLQQSQYLLGNLQQRGLQRLLDAEPVMWLALICVLSTQRSPAGVQVSRVWDSLALPRLEA
jgi:hypothetical protein